MKATWVAAILVGLLAVLHSQMWWGRGSVMQVREWRAELQSLQDANKQSRLRNEQLANEVRDLLDGLDMVEELARYDLGMVKPNEIFVQIHRTEP
jgi:cell division protein FtsB